MLPLAETHRPDAVRYRYENEGPPRPSTIESYPDSSCTVVTEYPAISLLHIIGYIDLISAQQVRARPFLIFFCHDSSLMTHPLEELIALSTAIIRPIHPHVLR